MAFYRANLGGGNEVNLANPDIISQATMAQNATRSITVTKKPRYVVLTTNRQSDTTGRGQCFLYNVKTDTYTYGAYTSDGYLNSKNSSGKPTLITSVTSSSVGLKNTNAASVRTTCFIYY